MDQANVNYQEANTPTFWNNISGENSTEMKVEASARTSVAFCILRQHTEV